MEIRSPIIEGFRSPTITSSPFHLHYFIFPTLYSHRSSHCLHLPHFSFLYSPKNGDLVHFSRKSLPSTNSNMHCNMTAPLMEIQILIEQGNPPSNPNSDFDETHLDDEIGNHLISVLDVRISWNERWSKH